MGMYDTIKIDPKLLPVRKAMFAGIDWHKMEWQTKSLDCDLEHYELTENGLYHDLKDLPNFTGTINFYSDDAGKWLEFDATYKNGKLVSIIKL